MRARPELRDVSSDQQDKGIKAHAGLSTGHRLPAGDHSPDIDDALYDAFGQRQVSTIFTELNQYRAVLSVKPDFRQGPERPAVDLPSQR